jgi:speckle-type POZ protein
MTINVIESGQTISAHAYVLSPCSPVFERMLLGAPQSNVECPTTIDIPGMSFEACQALIRFIYGDIEEEEFLLHRSALLLADEKYQIDRLVKACQRSLEYEDEDDLMQETQSLEDEDEEKEEWLDCLQNEQELLQETRSLQDFMQLSV